MPRAHKAGLTLSLPLVNGYKFRDHKIPEYRTGTGLFGIGGAVFYRQKNIKYSLNGSYARYRHGHLSNNHGGLSPIPIATASENTNGGPMRKLKVSNLEALVHIPVVGALHGVAGVNYIKYNYEYNVKISNAILTERWIDRTMGVTAGIELGRNAGRLAFLYRPALLSFDTKYYYHHYITVDLRFDLTFWKSKY